MNVKVDGRNYLTVEVCDAQTFIPLENLTLEKHNLTIDYSGDNEDLIGLRNYDLEILPYIPTELWVADLNNLTFTAPEEFNGILKISGIINENITVINGSADIPIGDILPGKYRLNITYENITWQYNLTVHWDSPDWEMQIDQRANIYAFEWMEELESRDYSFYITNVPKDLTGTFTFYHDGEYVFENHDPLYYHSLQIRPKFDEAGNHTIAIVYSGDSYYKPTSKTVTYTISGIMDVYFINIYLYAVLPYNATGTLTVKVDGKKFNGKKLMVDSDFSEYGILHHQFDLNVLKKDKTYDIEVIYKGNLGSFSVTKKFKLDIDMYLIDKVAYYNEYPTISFNLPDDVKKKPKVTIDGAKFTYSNKYGSYDIDISKLKPRIHNITLYYPGDAKYPAKKVNDSFVIYASMNGKYSFEYEYGSKIKVSIKLPDDATGNLTVKINDSIYRSTSLKNGKATIMLPSNELGEYEYSAYYIGNDDVAPISNHITIIPKIKHTGNEIIRKPAN